MITQSAFAPLFYAEQKRLKKKKKRLAAQAKQVKKVTPLKRKKGKC